MILLTRDDAALSEPTVITLGNFDGFHAGHMGLINETLRISRKKSLKSVLFSFNPHAGKILRSVDFKLIFTPEEKRFIAAELCLDIFYECAFTQDFSQLSAKGFCEFLMEKLRPVEIVVGSGYRFGHMGRGDEFFLQSFCDMHEVGLTVIPTLKSADGQRISSSLARETLSFGDWDAYGKLIERPYFIIAESVLRISANEYLLTIHEDKLTPTSGTYKILAKCDAFVRTGEIILPEGRLIFPDEAKIPPGRLLIEFIKNNLQ